MVSNSAMVGLLIVISVYYFCLTCVFTTVQSQTPPDIVSRGIDGIFKKSNDLKVVINDTREIPNEGGPLKNFDEIICSNNQPSSNNRLNISIPKTGPGQFISIQEYIENQQKLLIFKVINKIKDKLEENVLKTKVSWRIKSPSSIRLKMFLRNLTMDQLTDIIGIRFIVNKVEECYKLIGIINNLFKYLQDDFKDYIKYPKASGYQSLHTVIIGEINGLGANFNTKIEIQVRTVSMDYIAHFGCAAHSIYKKTQIRLVNQLGYQIT